MIERKQKETPGVRPSVGDGDGGGDELPPSVSPTPATTSNSDNREQKPDQVRLIQTGLQNGSNWDPILRGLGMDWVCSCGQRAGSQRWEFSST